MKLAISARARPDAPSGYAPAHVDCPKEKPTIRLLGAGSTSRASTPRPTSTGFASDVKNLPNIRHRWFRAAATALLKNGAGFISAADIRILGFSGKGGLCGLLQASTYLSGLSGGGWLVSSIYANNFTTVETLRKGREDSSIWRFDNSIFTGPDLSGIFDTPRYWAKVASQVSDKDDAGFETSITDYWGRALAWQLIDAPEGGPSYTFSSIADDEEFSNARAPFPILVADGRAPGEKIISLNATVYEFNPYEMGSWDPTTFGFAPMRYLASNFSNGVVPRDGKCVRGFDSLSYIFGTSSSLFNAFLLQNISSVEGVPDFLIDAGTSVLKGLDADKNDIAQYVPNPFLGWNKGSNPTAGTSELDLVDGGMDLQNIPLHPLIQPFRSVDVIFAVDSSADTTYAWPNGTAMRASFDRVRGSIANGTLFPAVPDDKTFLAQGLNSRPTFFGCDAANFTLAQGQTAPPLIVYVPNAPYTAMSNVTTFTPSYTLPERDGIIRNGYDAATQGNGTLDTRWQTCVACAVMSRSWTRTETAVPAVCNSCFERYCWNGTLADASVAIASGGGGAEYEPTFKIGNGNSDESAGVKVVGRSAWALMVGLVAAVAVL